MSIDRIPRIEQHLETIQDALVLTEMVAMARHVASEELHSLIDDATEERAFSCLADILGNARVALKAVIAALPAGRGFIEAPEVE